MIVTFGQFQAYASKLSRPNALPNFPKFQLKHNPRYKPGLLGVPPSFHMSHSSKTPKKNHLCTIRPQNWKSASVEPTPQTSFQTLLWHPRTWSISLPSPKTDWVIKPFPHVTSFTSNAWIWTILKPSTKPDHQTSKHIAKYPPELLEPPYQFRIPYFKNHLFQSLTYATIRTTHCHLGFLNQTPHPQALEPFPRCIRRCWNNFSMPVTKNQTVPILPFSSIFCHSPF